MQKSSTYRKSISLDALQTITELASDQFNVLSNEVKALEYQMKDDFNSFKNKISHDIEEIFSLVDSLDVNKSTVDKHISAKVALQKLLKYLSDDYETIVAQLNNNDSELNVEEEESSSADINVNMFSWKKEYLDLNSIEFSQATNQTPPQKPKENPPKSPSTEKKDPQRAANMSVPMYQHKKEYVQLNNVNWSSVEAPRTTQRRLSRASIVAPETDYDSDNDNNNKGNFQIGGTRYSAYVPKEDKTGSSPPLRVGQTIDTQSKKEYISFPTLAREIAPNNEQPIPSITSDENNNKTKDNSKDNINKNTLALMSDPILAKYIQHLPKIVKGQKILRKWVRQQRLKKMVRAYMESDQSKMGRTRLNIVKEIIQTEKNYLLSITLLVDFFVIPMRVTGILPDDLISNLFRNCDSIVGCNENFLEKLLEPFGFNRIGKTFLEIAPFFHMYGEYITNYDKATELLKSTVAEKSNVAEFLKKCELEARAFAGKALDIYDLMIQPIQRIPRYALLLGELLKYTEQDHVDRANIELALDLIRKLTEHINEGRKQSERIQKIVEVQDRIQGNFLKLVEPHRVFICEGDLIKLWEETHEELHFFLFNDILIYCHTNRSLLGSKVTYKYLSFFIIHLALVVDILDQSDGIFRFAISYPSRGQSFLLGAKNAADKKTWMVNLDKQIKAQSTLRSRTSTLRDTGENNDFLLGTTMRGWLTKRGQQVKNWKKRYFKLKGNTLFYYVQKSDTQPIGMIVLRREGTTNYTVKISNMRKHCIELHSPSGRSYYLSADEEAILKPWLFFLREIIPIDPDVLAYYKPEEPAPVK